MAQNTTRLEGKVIGYSVRFVPAQRTKRRGWAENFKAKMGAFIHILPNVQDDQEAATAGTKPDPRPVFIPCRAVELIYDMQRLTQLGVDAAEELDADAIDVHRIQVLQSLLDQHPVNSVRAFHERVKTIDRGKQKEPLTIKKYSLVE